MGGDVAIESEPGQGATFRFEIALDAALTPLDLGDSRDTAPRVLIVDPSSEDRAVLAQHLSRLGVSTEEVRTGAEAIGAAAFVRDAVHAGPDGTPARRWRRPADGAFAARPDRRIAPASHRDHQRHGIPRRPGPARRTRHRRMDRQAGAARSVAPVAGATVPGFAARAHRSGGSRQLPRTRASSWWRTTRSTRWSPRACSRARAAASRSPATVAKPSTASAATAMTSS